MGILPLFPSKLPGRGARVAHAAGGISIGPVGATGPSALWARANPGIGANRQRGTPNERFHLWAKELAWK
jgi:hypothetical protein